MQAHAQQCPVQSLLLLTATTTTTTTQPVERKRLIEVMSKWTANKPKDDDKTGP